MKYKIVERDAFQVVGICKEFSCGEMNNGIPGVPGFWGEVNENGTSQQLAQLINGQINGLLGITTNYNRVNNTVDYWIGAEHCGIVPDGLLSFQFPPSKWVVFEVCGPIPGAIINAWKQIYSEWFPLTSYQQANIAPIEAYIDLNLDSLDSFNEIWVAIK
jgi:AraC family transcriptional regulator